MTATSANAKDTRLDPLLAQALAVPPDSPAFATVRYHFFRLAIARGSSRTALFEKVRHTRAALPRTTGISTRNAFTALAAETAPSVDAFLREATLVPAGVTDDSEPAIFVPDRPPALPPEIVDMIAMGLPLSGWRDAALSPLLPEPVRAHVAATAWTRAELLGDRATSKAVAAIAAKLNPALRVYVERIEKAKTDDERRLGVVFALLKLPTLGPRVDAWYASAAPAEGITTAYGHYLWCAEPPPVPGARAPSPAYATAAERDTATKERLALSKLGAGATWLAREAARLAHVLPDDPRIPEALHLAVRATRYACKDDGTRAASKGAFTALQKRYKDSSWAKATPHYY
jgi:hypothetical protein